MKKKVWIATNIFFVLIAIMVIMTVISIFVDYRLAVLSGIFTILSAILVAVYILKSKAYKTKALNDVVKNIDEKVLFSRMPVPIVIVGDFGDIIWVNESFYNEISPVRECVGLDVGEFILGQTVRELSRKNKNTISVGERRYSVYVEDFNNCTVLMFIDDTDHENLKKIFSQNKPIVTLISLDNKEDLTDDNEFSLQILADIESTVRKWVVSAEGLFKKLSDGKYLAVMQNKFIESFAENNFTILDDIRNIKLNNGISATISIGIGRGGLNFSECELWARQALEMALGRGGDQAIIKEGSSFEFFGGKSKGVERRDRVKTRIIASMLADSIKESDDVFIMGHRFSDLDSIGAAVGLFGCITSEFNKPAHVVIDKKRSLAGVLVKNIEASEIKDVFIGCEEADNLFSDNSLLIVVDTHSKGFLEDIQLCVRSKKTVVIDHHRMTVNRIENSLIFYHDSFASSTSEMVTDLMRYMGEKAVNKTTAQALLSGIMLDTKNFVLRTGVRTFEAAAFLKQKGADTVKVKKMFADDMDAYKIKYEIVAGAELYNSCAIACVPEKYTDVRIVAAQAADELLGIREVRASFVIFRSNGEINISSRSLGSINVQVVMEKLGGGGHLTMAATQLKDVTVDGAKQMLMNVIDSIVNDEKKQVNNS